MNTPHPFAGFITSLGRGKKGSRSLSFDESVLAMDMILKKEVMPEQLGAFLMLLRVKEETPQELSGFVTSVKKHLEAQSAGLIPQADLDWSSYAGKRKQAPWFLLAIFALANAGYRIFIHGGGAHTKQRVYTHAVIEELGLPLAQNWQQASQHLDASNLCYLSADYFLPELNRLIQLKPILGLRSPINTLMRIINPCDAKHSLSSVFHPAYMQLQAGAQQELKQALFATFKGEGGEIESRPDADLKLLRLNNQQIETLQWPRLLKQKAKADEKPNLQTACQQLSDYWHGNESNEYAQMAVERTMAIALALLKPDCDESQLHSIAKQIWLKRDKNFFKPYQQA